MNGQTYQLNSTYKIGTYSYVLRNIKTRKKYERNNELCLQYDSKIIQKICLCTLVFISN